MELYSGRLFESKVWGDKEDRKYEEETKMLWES